MAIQRVAACLCSTRPKPYANPLFLHGPAGAGKTLLVNTLVEELSRRAPQLNVKILPASDFTGHVEPLFDDESFAADAIDRCADLLIVEDLQHLPSRSATTLATLFDDLEAAHCQMIFTAAVGPRLLQLPARLTSRLASGLVVGLEPLQAASRLRILEDKAQRRQLAVSRDVLAWLAKRLTGGGRQLDGALTQLESLSRVRPGPVDLPTVARHFREQADASRPTVERIVRRVSGHFQVKPREIQSARRTRSVLLPRQVGMYLARELTDLSLDQIGAYFGGRDHSTVLHACRKLERAIAHDTELSGTIRQLQAGLM